MPGDIHVTLWQKISSIIEAGTIAATLEIYDELTRLIGPVGDCIRTNQPKIVMEVGQASWNWSSYIQHSNKMLTDHSAYISEMCGGSRRTVGVNDISIIALGKALSIPVVSSEVRRMPASKKWRHIPDVCDMEGVLHMTFNEFLRAEGIQA